MVDKDWEEVLANEGMPSELPEEQGTQVSLGNGLGTISAEADEKEDEGVDGLMCPINLGVPIDDTSLNQPNDRPTETAALDDD